MITCSQEQGAANGAGIEDRLQAWLRILVRIVQTAGRQKWPLLHFVLSDITRFLEKHDV